MPWVRTTPSGRPIRRPGFAVVVRSFMRRHVLLEQGRRDKLDRRPAPCAAAPPLAAVHALQALRYEALSRYSAFRGPASSGRKNGPPRTPWRRLPRGASAARARAWASAASSAVAKVPRGVAHLAAVPQPRQCRARYGFTFEPASKTPLKPVELSERWSVSLQIL